MPGDDHLGLMAGQARTSTECWRLNAAEFTGLGTTHYSRQDQCSVPKHEEDECALVRARQGLRRSPCANMACVAGEGGGEPRSAHRR